MRTIITLFSSRRRRPAHLELVGDKPPARHLAMVSTVEVRAHAGLDLPLNLVPKNAGRPRYARATADLWAHA